MALITPIVTPIIPFPASLSYTFKFSIIGSGSQVTANQIEVQKTLDNSVVFTEKISNFAFEHIVVGNTFTNNISYKIRITTYDINNVASTPSDWVVFKCLSAPTLSINNIGSGIVGNQSYTFQGSYSQLEGEVLSSYQFYLYDVNSVQLTIGAQNYDGVMRQTFSTLQDSFNYFVEMKIITANGILATTGLVPFAVRYTTTQLSSALNLSNDFQTGSIQINANILQIIGNVGSGTATFQPIGTEDWVNLTNGMAYFQQGFTLTNDFTLRLWIKTITNDVTFLKLISSQGTIELKFNSTTNRIDAYKTTGNFTYHIYSQIIAPISTSVVFVYLQQIQNYLNLKAEILP